MRIAVFALAAIVAVVLGGEGALADDPRLWSGLEIRGGVLAHDVSGLWSGFRLESGFDINAELLFGNGVSILGGALRPAIGGSVNTVGHTSKAYADLRWEIEMPSRVFFGLGLGAAVHDGNLSPTEVDRKALGSRVLFHIPLELGLRLDDRQSVSVYFEHMSNAGTARFNEGMDGIGVRYGYRF